MWKEKKVAESYIRIHNIGNQTNKGKRTSDIKKFENKQFIKSSSLVIKE